MGPTMPSPQEIRDAPELALLTSLAYCLEAAQLALAANYPCLYQDESDPDEPHTEQLAYARGVFSQIDALLPLVDGYLASSRRAISPANRQRYRADDTSF